MSRTVALWAKPQFFTVLGALLWELLASIVHPYQHSA